jgi:hypothetical protein
MALYRAATGSSREQRLAEHRAAALERAQQLREEANQADPVRADHCRGLADGYIALANSLGPPSAQGEGPSFPCPNAQTGTQANAQTSTSDDAQTSAQTNTPQTAPGPAVDTTREPVNGGEAPMPQTVAQSRMITANQLRRQPYGDYVNAGRVGQKVMPVQKPGGLLTAHSEGVK